MGVITGLNLNREHVEQQKATMCCFKFRSKRKPLGDRNNREASPDQKPKKDEDEPETVQSLLKRDENGRTVVHEAASNGDVKALRGYKNKGLDLNIADNDGVTPAHVAAENNRWNVLEVLHFLDANLNVKDVCSQTPAHYGAWHGYKDVIKTLNKFGIPLNVTDEDKKTPAHYAARQGHCGVLKALYQINPQLFSAKDNDGKSPLFYATGQAADMFCVRPGTSREDRRIDFQTARVPFGSTSSTALNAGYGSPRAGDRQRPLSTGRQYGHRSSGKSEDDYLLQMDRGSASPRRGSATPRNDASHTRPPRRCDSSRESPSRRVSPRMQREDYANHSVGGGSYRSLPPLKEQEFYPNDDWDRYNGQRDRRIDDRGGGSSPRRAGSAPRRKREQDGRSTTPQEARREYQAMRTPSSSRGPSSPRARDRYERESAGLRP